MHQEDLARKIAEETGVTPAEAADELDSVVNRILDRLRKGKSASLGTLGVFRPGPIPNFEFRKNVQKAKR